MKERRTGRKEEYKKHTKKQKKTKKYVKMAIKEKETLNIVTEERQTETRKTKSNLEHTFVINTLSYIGAKKKCFKRFPSTQD